MNRVWSIILDEDVKYPIADDWKHWRVVMKNENGEKAEGRGSTPQRAYQAALEKLVLKPAFMDVK